ncbi:hypothetical protein FGB62_299g07 [Gracilaria domingensis]|nr:hypothetical protein FGB62_299g07 [Gracilaria domingensis]
MPRQQRRAPLRNGAAALPAPRAARRRRRRSSSSSSRARRRPPRRAHRLSAAVRARVRAAGRRLPPPQGAVVPQRRRHPAGHRRAALRVGRVARRRVRRARAAARVRALGRPLAHRPQPVQRPAHRPVRAARRVRGGGRRDRRHSARRHPGRGAVAAARARALAGRRRVPDRGLCGLRAGRRPRAVRGAAGAGVRLDALAAHGGSLRQRAAAVALAAPAAVLGHVRRGRRPLWHRHLVSLAHRAGARV